MTKLEWKWADETTPSVPGWYPVLRCWDAEEGSWPGGACWTGAKWVEGPVSQFIDQPCGTETQAFDVAWENDPDI